MAGIIHKFFGTRSGFEMIDHSIKSDVCHIDIVKCPYFSICSDYGCPELTTVFCNGDDVAYGNMHFKLSWDRKKTLGRGDNCCDFILRIIKQILIYTNKPIIKTSPKAVEKLLSGITWHYIKFCVKANPVRQKVACKASGI